MVINSKVLFQDENFMIYARRNRVFRVNDFGKEDFLFEFPVIWYQRIFLWSRLLTRILRLGVYRATIFEDHYFFCFHKKMYSFNIKLWILTEEFIFEKGHGPLTFCDGRGIHGFDEALYFGEYFSDDNLDLIRILKRNR